LVKKAWTNCAKKCAKKAISGMMTKTNRSSRNAT
jgi:hypothetical protein